MLKVEYAEKFLKDLKKLRRLKIYNVIKDLCIEQLPTFEDLRFVPHLKRWRGTEVIIESGSESIESA